MKKKVIMWHGRNEVLMKTLTSICGKFDQKNKCFWYDGSVDDFFKKYSGPVLICPEYWAVTQYSSFSQR